MSRKLTTNPRSFQPLRTELHKKFMTDSDGIQRSKTIRCLSSDVATVVPREILRATDLELAMKSGVLPEFVDPRGIMASRDPADNPTYIYDVASAIDNLEQTTSVEVPKSAETVNPITNDSDES